jgi:hypothetical protein
MGLPAAKRRMVMGLPVKSRTLVAAAAAGLSLALLPAQAQFWEPWGGRQQHQRQPSNPFGGGFWAPFEHRQQPQPYRDRGDMQQRDMPIDYSRAPPPAQKKPEATTNIVVMGDAMADWLALGLEEAFSEKPEIGIVRKHRTESGLIRYDQRRDIEWAQIAKEIIAAEKPKYIVMMVGNNDRQPIREKAPVARTAAPGAPKAPQAAPGQQAQSTTPPAPQAATPPDPERQAAEPRDNPEPPPTPEQIRAGALGPWEFHTEKWEAAYIRRIDATMAALKTAGVPVIWVGLPPQRATKASTDSAYLNEIYRSRAEKAGITYVDVWDGFVDESGRFTQQGPDYEGQTRRLRSGDGIFFTKFGARKLAHYVEREIQRHIANRAVPVALPIPVEPGGQPGAARPGGPAQRPAVGPVIPLTASAAPPAEELMGGARPPARQTTPDPVASRVLTKGEPITAPTGRADDFAWPRGSASIAEPVALQPTPPSPPPPGASGTGQKAGQPGAGATAQRGTTDAQAAGEPKQKRAPRQYDGPRPPFSIFQGFFR